MGINIRYNSQNDDGSTVVLQLIKDEHFDSEDKMEKQYIPVHFTPSEKSEMQFAFEMKNNLVQKEETQIRIVVYSEAALNTTMRMVLSDQDGKIVYQSEKGITLKVGLDHLIEPLPIPDMTGLYSLKLTLDDRLENELEFYRLSSDKIPDFEKRLEKFAREAQKAEEISSYHGLAFKLNELRNEIEAFDPRDAPRVIEQSVTTLSHLLDRCVSQNHIYTKAGYLRTAFLSQTDKTLQPYFIYLPDRFDLNQRYKLFIALHGSGVDEVDILKYVGNEIADSGYIVAAPRGRELSDCYVGQTENDVRDMIEVLKGMFNIDKTLIFGFSMGGYGVWRLTFLFPDLFKAAIVGSGAICVPLDESHPERDITLMREGAKQIPYLVMHGTKDRAVPFKDIEEFVETLKGEGFDVTFKVYEGAGHGNYDALTAVKNWLSHYEL
jgi:predicted esterase